ncbi:PqqD family peptide modification chaperone [Raineyella fluvialis]|uniref:PqqD family peptide modification chaperone n=1 Tax=Raineyella fluvialis TaxID=2662261 RepID=A0A5Q2FBI9_9ACTN|nr:PqqD family peptide modification chaperone [Raineyella fluvialis]QGF23771.1 PqqD family peptide modification chaperone [Raineyella fluvialis]
MFHEWLDDSLVVCEPVSGDIYTLAGSGAEIYQLYADKSDDEVLAELSRSYPDEPPSNLAHHRDLFVAKLVAAGLMTRSD